MKGRSEYHQHKKVIPVKLDTKEQLKIRRGDGETIDGYLNRLMNMEKEFNEISKLFIFLSNSILEINNKLDTLEQNMTNSLVLNVKYRDITKDMYLVDENLNTMQAKTETETKISIEKTGLLVNQFNKNKKEGDTNENSVIGNNK